MARERFHAAVDGLRGSGWGRFALTAALAATSMALYGELAARMSSSSTRLIVVAAMLAQLPLVAASGGYVYRLARLNSARCAAMDLGSRAEYAEAALEREQDRMHELRATVVGITASYRLLHGSGTELSRDARARLDRLHAAELERLERLLADRPSAPHQVVDLATTIEPMVESLRFRGHRVRWDGTATRVLGQPDDVAEVVHVLLENAARHAAGHDVEVAVTELDGWVEVYVRDHGPGVSPDVVPVLFERGARAPSSPGQGIGLHIAHRLTTQMGGDLRHEVPDGSSGAVFVLAMPGPPHALLGLSG